MSFFKNREGHDGDKGDKGEVKAPKISILQTPETQADKSKLENKKPEDNSKNRENGNSFKDKYKVDTDKLPPIERKGNSADGSASGSPNKGQRERERGRTTDMER